MGVNYVKGGQQVMAGASPMAARDIFTESDAALQPLGSRLDFEDGRSFVYCKNGGTALAAGKLASSPAEVANHTNCAVAAAAAVGTNEVTITLGATAATKDQYAGGFLYINDAAGEGYTYRVSSHPAADASGSLVLTLADKVRYALTTSSEASLVYNKFANLVVAPATTAVGTPVGVPAIAVTASYYFWAQCAGPAAVLQVGTLVAGANAVTPTGTAGGVGPSGAATSVDVGTVMQIAATTEYAMIDLKL